MSRPSVDRLEELYRTAPDVRTSGLTAESAARFYDVYLRFVESFAPAGRLLDVGCGCGWSTALFAGHGYQATGIDLNPSAFEPPARHGLTLTAGSGTSIPFPDGSFDVVAAFQTLEHVPDPGKMLDEMVRVVRPGGVICVVSPNLLGLNGYFSALTRWVWHNRPLYSVLIRTPGMSRHPFGNTLPEALGGLMVAVCRIVRKSASRRARFTFRTPDLQPPFHGDNDAVYLCNPLDLTRYFRDRGCEVLQDKAPGRSGLTRMLATGTWVAVRAPAGSSSR